MAVANDFHIIHAVTRSLTLEGSTYSKVRILQSELSLKKEATVHDIPLLTISHVEIYLNYKSNTV